MTCSGVPSKRARSTGSCVAMPTGQVFRWHLRIMMQPIATRGAVAKPNSSAPSSAAMATSRPVCSLPSVCTRMRLRRSLSNSTCCVSARPSSHGMPACLIELSGDAPVPPLSPLIRTTSADRKSTRLNSSHMSISYAVFCLKTKTVGKISKPYFDKKDIDTKAYEIEKLAEARAKEMKIIATAVKENFHLTGGIEYTEEKLSFFNDTATTEIYTLSLHDALPI